VFFCAKTSFRIVETRFSLLLRCWEHAALQVASSPLAFINHASGYQTIIHAHARAPLLRAGFSGATLALDCTNHPLLKRWMPSRFVVRLARPVLARRTDCLTLAADGALEACFSASLRNTPTNARDAPAGRRKLHRRVDRLAPAERPAICQEMGTAPLQRSRMERGAARVIRQGPGARAGDPPGGPVDAPTAPRTRRAPVRRVGAPRARGGKMSS